VAGHLGGSNSRGRRLNAKLDEIPLFLLYGSVELLPTSPFYFVEGTHSLNGLIECDNSYCNSTQGFLFDRPLERNLYDFY
jgi:hypothetical protein